MNARDAAKLLIAIARPLAYQRKGTRFWRTGDEITLLCQLENNPWGKGIYINYGITPNQMVLNSIPPGYEYWGMSGRATSIRSPFRDIFDQLATARIDDVSASEVEEAFRWLLDWMEEQFGDAGTVRRAVLTMPHDSCVLWDAMVLVLMRDWAKGELKEPSHYFEGTRYYRS